MMSSGGDSPLANATRVTLNGWGTSYLPEGYPWGGRRTAPPTKKPRKCGAPAVGEAGFEPATSRM